MTPPASKPPGGETKHYRAANRVLWDSWTRLHVVSPFYDVAGFRAGKLSLRPVEQEELGAVAGRSLLHLQCHFGLDTLSWARLGANVTGVDFSPEAIREARWLAEDTGLAATFVCSDVYELPAHLDAQFDFVFTSYGVLPWLPDLTTWAQVIAHFMKPGGVFYLVEFHPLAEMLDDTGTRITYPYLSSEKPLEETTQGSYADPDAPVVNTSFEWPHGLGEVVTALCSAGLRIEFLHEFAYSTHRYPSYVEEADNERFVAPGLPGIPLMFSIRATLDLPA